MLRSSILACGLLALLMAPLGARGAAIYVNTTDDVVGDDGVCSLREAVSAANNNVVSGASAEECAAGEPDPIMDVIVLDEKTYSLTLEPADENANAGGDLDVFESLAIRGAGSKTVIKNGIGSAKTLGDGDRILHIDANNASSGTVDLHLERVTLRDGDVSCDGANCDQGSACIEDDGDGEMTLLGVVLSDNALSCTGAACGCVDPDGDCGDRNGAALSKGAGSTLTLYDVTIQDNEASCDDTSCGTAAIVDVLLQDGDVWLQNVSVLDNTTECKAQDCTAGSTFHIVDVAEFTAVGIVVEGNRSECEGDDCEATEIWEIDTDNGADFAMQRDLRFEKNVVSCEGADCELDEILEGLNADEETWVGLVVSSNTVDCEGDRCRTEEVADIDARLLSDVEMRSNRVSCKGEECQPAPVLWLEPDEEEEIHIENLSLVSNRIDCDGDGCAQTDDEDPDVGDMVLIAWDTSADVHLRDVVVEKNQMSCKGDVFDPGGDDKNCEVDALFTIVNPAADNTWYGGRFAKNRMECSGEDCDLDEVLRIDGGDEVEVVDLELTGNRQSCKGDTCDTDEILKFDNATNVTLSRVIVEKNKIDAKGDGSGTGADNTVRIDAAALDLFNVEILKNKASCKGDECDSDAALGVAGSGLVRMVGTLVEKNQVKCQGADCLVEAAVVADDVNLACRESVISGNKVSCKKSTCIRAAGLDLVGSAQAALDRCTVEKNKGDGSGAVYVEVGSTFGAMNSEIKSNKGKEGAGGIQNEGTVAGGLVGTVFSGNKPSGTDCVDANGGTGCPVIP